MHRQREDWSCSETQRSQRTLARNLLWGKDPLCLEEGKISKKGGVAMLRRADGARATTLGLTRLTWLIGAGCDQLNVHHVTINYWFAVFDVNALPLRRVDRCGEQMTKFRGSCPNLPCDAARAWTCGETATCQSVGAKGAPRPNAADIRRTTFLGAPDMNPSCVIKGNRHSKGQHGHGIM